MIIIIFQKYGDYKFKSGTRGGHLAPQSAAPKSSRDRPNIAGAP